MWPSVHGYIAPQEKENTGAVTCILDMGGIGKGRFERSAGARFSKDLNHSDDL